MSISDRIFISGSNVGSFISAGNRLYGVPKKESTAGSDFIYDTFIFSNLHIYENITSSINLLGSVNLDFSNINNGLYNIDFIDGFYNNHYAFYLNTLLNKRNGSYGWSSWRQIRNDWNPIIKQQLKNNEIIYLEPAKSIRTTGGTFLTALAKRGNVQNIYVEPFITVKHKNLVTVVRDPETNNNLVIKHSFGNNVVTFSNLELNNKLGLFNRRAWDAGTQLYGVLRDSYTGKMKSALNGQFQYMKYSETIYPAQRNTFLKEVRGRTNYYINWKDNRSARQIINVTNSQGYSIPTSSIWPLDGRNDFETANCVTGGIDGSGELQNNYTTFFQTSSLGPFVCGNHISKVIQFNTGSNLSSHIYLQDGINCSASWDSLLGGGTVVGGERKFSVNAWVYFTSSLDAQTNKQMIIEFGSYAQPGKRAFYLATGSGGVASSTRRLAFSASYAIGVAGNNEWITRTTAEGGTELTEKTWYNVGCFFDPLEAVAADRVKLYVNGVEQLKSAVGLTSATVDNIDGIGGGSVSVANIGSGTFEASPFMGMMSNLSIFSGTFSADEMAEIYNNGYPQSLYYHSRRNNLISWWPLGDGQGIVSYNTDINFIAPGFGSIDGVYGANLGAYIATDSTSGSIEEGIHRWVYDMATDTNILPAGNGRNVVQPNMTMGCLVPASIAGLKGVADKERELPINFKVGVLYSRRFPEYVGIPYPTMSISCSQGYKYIRVTGSRVFAGDNKWLTGEQSNLSLYYKNYDDYSNDIKTIGKDYTIIPEFKISEHMDYYLNEKNGNFFVDNEQFLSLTGSEYIDCRESGFFKTYSHSDFLQNFEVLKSDHKEVANPYNLKLKCKGVVKFLPYEGFYPAQWTLQLAEIFSQSYGEYVKPYGLYSGSAAYWRAFVSPIFSLLYNSIKCSCATDFPVYTDESPQTIEDYAVGGNGGKDFAWVDFNADSYNLLPLNSVQNNKLTTRGIYGAAYQATSSAHLIQAYRGVMPISLSSSFYQTSSYGDYLNIDPISLDSSASFATVLCTNFSKRLPFSALVELENYLAKSKIWDMESDYSASLRSVLTDSSTNQAAVWSGQSKLNFKLAMHNFLASVPDFYLKDGKLTTFYSNPINDNSGIVINAQDIGYYAMDVVVSLSDCRSLTDFVLRRELPEFSASMQDFYPISKQEINNIKGVHTITYERDSAFGPPYVYSDYAFTGSNTAYSFHYGFEHVTPAWQNGFGVIRLKWYPFKGAGQYSIKDIQSTLTCSYIRYPTDRVGNNGIFLTNQLLDFQVKDSIDDNLKYRYSLTDDGITPLYSSSMPMTILSASLQWQHLSSSIDVFGIQKVKGVTYQRGERGWESVEITDNVQNESTVWTISPKWESPVLNFIDCLTGSVASGHGSGSLTRGLWHQYGRIPDSSEGLIFSIQDLPSVVLKSKNWHSGTSARGFLFQDDSEDTINLKNINASCTLYIRDSSQLSGKIFYVDGYPLKHKDVSGLPWSSWNTGSTNYETALSIVAAITGAIYWPQQGSDPSADIRERVNAYAYIPTEHPWINYVESSTTGSGPVAAVKITIKDASEQYYTISDYKNWYASGEIGNKKMCYLSDSTSSFYWILEGGSDTSGMTKIRGHNVYFTGGITSKYKAKSLADLLGFTKISKKLGELAEEKFIKEAVVAIPFKEINGGKKFFNISRRKIDLALGVVKKFENEQDVGQSIVEMCQKIQNYVLPPKFDFIVNKNIDPIVMYIFEFFVKLDKDDLANIWQNLPPKSMKSFKIQESVVEHILNDNELLNQDLNLLRWMVFKVKQKGKINYFEMTADSQDDQRFKFEQFKDNNGIPQYSYNYPYDQCSIVELAKIDVEVDFIKK